MELKGKVAFVTGAAQGIGRSYCLALLENECKVCICDINEQVGQKFMDEVSEKNKDRVMFAKCDVSEFADFEAAFEKAIAHFGYVDILINNAGIVDERNWKRTVNVNFIGVIHGIQIAFKHMGIDNGGNGGYVVNTASNTGFVSFPLSPIYAACKHGVVGLTRGFGSEFHFNKTGVKVSAVCPGPTATPLYYNFAELSVDKAAATELLSTINPVDPKECAEALIKLLEDDKNGALLLVYENMRYADSQEFQAQ